jgi:hypothetical protein
MKLIFELDEKLPRKHNYSPSITLKNLMNLLQKFPHRSAEQQNTPSISQQSDQTEPAGFHFNP